MEKTSPQKLIFTSLLLCSSIIICFLISASEGAALPSHHHHHHHHCHHRPQWDVDGGFSTRKKLFVFGDSYADTGNCPKSLGSSWKVPYGMTFPGVPSGRFSDGRIFTDFLAKFLGLRRSPIPYRRRKYMIHKLRRYGVNFAFGGTGVFDTLTPLPNMTTQIDFLQQLLKDSVFTPWDVCNSVALVSLAGNDYATFLGKGGSAEGLLEFIPKVVTQLALDLQRISMLGVKKIVVTSLQPLGCLPAQTISNWFQQCNSTDNKAVSFHNLLLQQAISKFNNQRDVHRSSFVMLDLYNAFLSVFQQRGTRPGSLMFESPLKPCCMGVNQNFSCGSVDAWGNKMYTVCKNPKTAFFWDSLHPTQAGWNAVYLNLHATLEEELTLGSLLAY